MTNAKFKSTTLLLQCLVVLGAAGLVGGTGYSLFVSSVRSRMRDYVSDLAGVAVDWEFSTASMGLTLAIVLTGVAIMLLALFRIFTVLKCIREGDALSPRMLVAVRQSGQALLSVLAFRVLGEAMVSVTLSMDAPTGQKILALGFELHDLWLAVAGGLLILIGTVLCDAIEAVTENREFV